ncbi:MAG: hypothetical protein ABI193_07265 [Minicystis sp.]
MRYTRAGLPLALAVSFLACGGTATTGSGGGSTTSTTNTTTNGSGGHGGAGGSAPTCADLLCSKPGELCVEGACVVDCRKPGAQPCTAGDACDVSDMSPGKCVPLGSPCLTTSPPEACGAKVCGPGSACDGNGKCYPRVPCGSVACDDAGCFGTQCTCTREPGCLPAPLGMPGEAGTLHDPDFLKGLTDLEIDPGCNAWGVTLISGPDYLRSLSTSGVAVSYPGVTNLNMGEVSVLQQISIPKSGHGTITPPDPVPPNPQDLLDVALTYICCSTCGCQLQSTPQGVAHFEPMTSMIPLVIPSQTFTDGAGPFGAKVIDTGPAGLTYGTDRVLYVGNVNVNGDYYRLDLKTAQPTLVTTFASRVYASTPFDAITMLVALEGGEIHLLRLTDGSAKLWATSEQPVTGLVRDFFDGAIYVARSDKALFKYDEAGKGALFQTTVGPARISIAPDGFLYALELKANFADTTPTVARFPLPLTR